MKNNPLSPLVVSIPLVDDQISSPTWARMLAEATTIILARGIEYIEERKGLVHLAGDGFANRCQWVRGILQYNPKREEQMSVEIQPALTREFPAPSALFCTGL